MCTFGKWMRIPNPPGPKQSVLPTRNQKREQRIIAASVNKRFSPARLDIREAFSDGFHVAATTIGWGCAMSL
jgi:hypothetical protein